MEYIYLTSFQSKLESVAGTFVLMFKLNWATLLAHQHEYIFGNRKKGADICCAGRHIETFHFGSNNGLQLADLLGSCLPELLC